MMEMMQTCQRCFIFFGFSRLHDEFGPVECIHTYLIPLPYLAASAAAGVTAPPAQPCAGSGRALGPATGSRMRALAKHRRAPGACCTATASCDHRRLAQADAAALRRAGGKRCARMRTRSRKRRKAFVPVAPNVSAQDHELLRAAPSSGDAIHLRRSATRKAAPLVAAAQGCGCTVRVRGGPRWHRNKGRLPVAVSARRAFRAACSSCRSRARPTATKLSQSCTSSWQTAAGSNPCWPASRLPPRYTASSFALPRRKHDLYRRRRETKMIIWFANRR